MLFTMPKTAHVAFGAALIGFAATGLPAQAAERICNASLGAITVDNLRVPVNATCRLTRTRVLGQIVVERGGILVASRILAIGNVQAQAARNVVIGGASRIGGSVQIVQGGAARISSSFIDGSMQVEDNARFVTLLNNTVGADVQASANRGGLDISDNRIEGNLTCSSNLPAPTGDGNIVKGAKEDQCRLL